MLPGRFRKPARFCATSDAYVVGERYARYLNGSGISVIGYYTGGRVEKSVERSRVYA
jgi:hypothetical protein